MSLFQLDGWKVSSKVKPADKEKKNKKKDGDVLSGDNLEDAFVKYVVKGEVKKSDNDEPSEVEDISKEKNDNKKENKRTKEKKDKQDKKDRHLENDIKSSEKKQDSMKTGKKVKAADKNKDRDGQKSAASEEDDSPTQIAVADDEEKQSAPVVKLTPLQQKMKEKLSGSRFRWINEQLYTMNSADALKLIKDHPEMFDQYHDGFRSQVQGWPENPVVTFLKVIKERLHKPIGAPGGLPGERDGTIVIADMGCGEAQLASELSKFKPSGKYGKRAKFEVHSFDLKKHNKFITVADIKNVPMANESANIVIFSLALMGTNFMDFIDEGLRILKPKGELWVAEIKSRFSSVDDFVEILKKRHGVFHKTTEDGNKMFIRFEFFKPNSDMAEQKQKKMDRKRKFIEKESDKDEFEVKRKKAAEGTWLLKPCIYKRR